MQNHLSNLSLSAFQQLIASLPSDLPESFFCPPPAAKTDPVQGLAALARSEQAGGIFHYRRYALSRQLTQPMGYWASAAGGLFGCEFMRRLQSYRFSA